MIPLLPTPCGQQPNTPTKIRFLVRPPLPLYAAFATSPSPKLSLPIPNPINSFLILHLSRVTSVAYDRFYCGEIRNYSTYFRLEKPATIARKPDVCGNSIPTQGFPISNWVCFAEFLSPRPATVRRNQKFPICRFASASAGGGVSTTRPHPASRNRKKLPDLSLKPAPLLPNQFVFSTSLRAHFANHPFPEETNRKKSRYLVTLAPAAHPSSFFIRPGGPGALNSPESAIRA
jgi:hypothetical protein